jgi:hypothetical protein
MALGYFVVTVKSQEYGVRRSDASMLASSYDAIERRTERRGTHVAERANFASARDIAIVYLSRVYGRSDLGRAEAAIDGEELTSEISANEIVFAPDGDAAFDDGSHILQFDVDQSVRVVAFKNDEDPELLLEAITEVWLTADEFYGILESWEREFAVAWETGTKQLPTN